MLQSLKWSQQGFIEMHLVDRDRCGQINPG